MSTRELGTDIVAEAMTVVLVAADAQWVRNQVRAAFVGPGQTVLEVARGQEVRTAVAQHKPDLVVLDSQIGNMGGIACALDLRLEASANRLPTVPVLLLLDREADRFLAQRTGVSGMLVKPVDAATLRLCARQLSANHKNL